MAEKHPKIAFHTYIGHLELFDSNVTGLTAL